MTKSKRLVPSDTPDGPLDVDNLVEIIRELFNNLARIADALEIIADNLTKKEEC